MESTKLGFPEAYAFFGSGCLLVLELVAGRLLAPQLGVSLYTWTSIIGVVLGGVALGNFLGGRIADRYPTRGVLGLLFLLASAASGLILVLVEVVDSLALPAGAPAILHVLWLFGAIFFLPSAILGAVTPLLTRLSLRSVDSTGRVVGRIQAAATLGSIVGTFLTGFLLVSLVGTRLIVAGVAALLLLLALAARPPWMRSSVAGIGAVVVVGAFVATVGALSESGCTKETNYFCIRVLDYGDGSGHEVRVMQLDKLVHGVSDLDEPTRLVYPYQLRYQRVLDAVYRRGDRVDSLLIGGGPYSFARYMELTYSGRMLVAEIDPGVTAAARAHFGLPPAGKTRIETVNEDARLVLAKLGPATRFDVVVGDAVSDLSVPFQLTTREFNDIVASRLRPDGLYLLNIVDGARFDFLRSMIRTLRATFPYVRLVVDQNAWPLQEGRRSTFVLLAARHAPRSAPAVVPPRELDAFVRAGHSVVLTDDHAPVDQLLAPVFGQRLKEKSKT